MVSLKFLVVLGLFFASSLAVFADTSKDETKSKEVNPAEATDNVQPQQWGGYGGRCRYGCCGYWGRYGCSRCCGSADEETDDVAPQQRGRGGCRYGCCGSYAHGQCSACCSPPSQVATEAEGADKTNVMGPQQRGRSGCRYGCCGSYAHGQCSACCSRPGKTAAEEEAKP